MSNFQARGLMSPTPDPLEIVNKPSVSTVGQSGSPGLNMTPPPPTGMLTQSNPVQPTAMFSLSGLGGIGGFDVTQSSVDNMFKEEEKKQQILNPLIADMGNFGLDHFSVQANDGFITKDQFGEIKDLLGSDQFTNILDKYNAGMKDTFGDEYDGKFQGYGDKRSVLEALGVTNKFKVPTDELGSFDYMQYNSQTGQFEKIEDKSKEVSKTNQIIKGIAESVPLIVATAGIGNALAGSAAISGLAGGNSLIATGIGKGIAAGGMTAMQGGDGGDILKSAVMGGIGGAAGESTKLLANAEHMATLSASAASSLQATSDLLNTANTVLKTAEAVDNKDILGVVQGGLQLSGLPSMGQYTTDTLLENFPDSEIVTKHAASISTGILKAFDKGLQGASPDDMLKSGIMSYFKDGGGLALGDFDIDLDSADFGLPESLQPIVDAFRAGIDAIDENVVTPVLDTVAEVAEGADQFVRDLPGEIEDVEGTIDAVNEPVDKLIRAIPGTKEDAEDVGDWLVDKGKGALEFLAGSLLGGSSGGSGGAQAPKDEYVDLTNITLNPSEMAKGFEYESLSNPYLRG